MFFFQINNFNLYQGHPSIITSAKTSLANGMASCLRYKPRDSNSFLKSNDYELDLENNNEFNYMFTASVTEDDKATFLKAFQQIEDVSCLK